MKKIMDRPAMKLMKGELERKQKTKLKKLLKTCDSRSQKKKGFEYIDVHEKVHNYLGI